VAPLWFERPTSWADLERDTSAWLGNRLQLAAQERLYGLRDDVLRSGDPHRLEQWRRLTTSDHLYYMCTKWFADGDVHKYFSPYESPYDAFVAFMNVAQDLEQAVAVPAVAGEGDWIHQVGLACVA
jgi:alpha-amylase